MTTVNIPVSVAGQLSDLLKEITLAQSGTDLDPKYVVTSEFVEVSKTEVTPLLKQWRKAKKELDERKAALENVERKIKDLMNGAEVLVIEETQQHVVESRVTTSQVIDTARLKKEQAELVNKYQRTRYSRNFRVLV